MTTADTSHFCSLSCAEDTKKLLPARVEAGPITCLIAGTVPFLLVLTMCTCTANYMVKEMEKSFLIFLGKHFRTTQVTVAEVMKLEQEWPGRAVM